MHKTLWILTIGLLFVSVGMASTTCPTGFLSAYLAPGFTCQTDNLIFSGFLYTPGGSSPVLPGSIGVTPITTALNEGFDFNPAEGGVGAGISQDEKISFTISTADGSSTIDDLGIFFNGSFKGTGGTSFTETFLTKPPSQGGVALTCNPPSPCDPFQVTNPPPSITNTVTFASPVSTLWVSKDIFGSTGAGPGQYGISEADNFFSQVVPEPGYTALLGAGLVGLAWLKRRRQTQG